MTGKPDDPCGADWRRAQFERTFGTDAEIAEAARFIALHCLGEGATPADAIRYAVLHTALTARRLIALQEADEDAPAKLH